LRPFKRCLNEPLAGASTADTRSARRFLSTCKIFTLAESVGGVESLIEHPAIMTHASVPPENRAKLGIVDGFIRLSVGIEDVADLQPDLEASFAAAKKAVG
jgi:cystathionine beta-lyase/cystathionine gamma-synthase